LNFEFSWNIPYVKSAGQALKRPGRLDREIYIGLPDDTARREIFEILFRKTPIADDVNIDLLVNRTQRYSGAEVSQLLTVVCVLYVSLIM